jgi:hypothetical protein
VGEGDLSDSPEHAREPGPFALLFDLGQNEVKKVMGETKTQGTINGLFPYTNRGRKKIRRGKVGLAMGASDNGVHFVEIFGSGKGVGKMEGINGIMGAGREQQLGKGDGRKVTPLPGKQQEALRVPLGIFKKTVNKHSSLVFLTFGIPTGKFLILLRDEADEPRIRRGL